jgi:hypothetical protein
MTVILKEYEPKDTIAEMEMEMALAKMKLCPKKDPNSLNETMASIECRYLIEMTNSKKKAQVLRLGGVMYSLVIATTQMIWLEKGKELPVATLLNKMHIQWRVAGGKNRDEKGSNDDKELVVPAIATEKKGEIKGGEKKTYKNPNKDKICNPCKKKGHVEASCWEKHPDKIPKKVKAARNKAKARKSSAAAVAIEEEIILGIVKLEKHPVSTIDVKDAYVCVPVEEESNYIFLNSYIESNEDKESPDLEEFDIHGILSKEEVITQEMSVTQLRQSKSQTMMTYGTSVNVDLDFGVIQASIAGKSKQKHSRELLELEDIWIADTGATSHVTKHSKGGVNHRKTDVKTRGARGVAAEASY